MNEQPLNYPRIII